MARDAMQAAVQDWSNATGERLQLAEGPGCISVEWDDDGERIPDALYLAYTYLDVDAAGTITGAHIIVNAVNYTWQRTHDGVIDATANGKRLADLDSVILHEMGHALGLDHTDKDGCRMVADASESGMPTMYSVILPGAQSLHVDDIAGICSIYGGELAPSMPGTVPSALPVVSPDSSKHRFGLDFTTSSRDSLDFSVTSAEHLGFRDKNAFLMATNG